MSLNHLMDTAFRLSNFCHKNPAIAREIRCAVPFMTVVRNAADQVRDAEARARIASIRSGDLPTYAKRIQLRPKTKVVRNKRGFRFPATRKWVNS